MNPYDNPDMFKKISEAFVILSNTKSRDAYDSLMKSRKTSYMSDPEIKTVESDKKSYLANRKSIRSFFLINSATKAIEKDSTWISSEDTKEVFPLIAKI